MKGRFLIPSSNTFIESNVYADKSAIVLDWLLTVPQRNEKFSLRQVTHTRNISIGLVQRTFNTLIFKGLLQTEGLRTAKKFYVKDAKRLLESWIDNYNIVKKCKMWTYRSPFKNRAALIKALENAGFSKQVSLALHTAADAYGCKNTNLNTLEIYLLEPTIRSSLEKILQLEPQESGYEVLLIEPYYKSLLHQNVVYQTKKKAKTKIPLCPPILTFLDLYHFPLRGPEQAEFMAERLIELKQLS